MNSTVLCQVLTVAMASLLLASCGSKETQSSDPSLSPTDTPTAAESATESAAIGAAPGAGSTIDPTTSTSQPSTVDVVAPKPSQQFELGLFDTEEMFAAGGGGCGMALTPAQEVLEEGVESANNMLLFHGENGSPMLMKINGEMVPFNLEEGRGEAFYGQTLSQTFSNAEFELIAVVDVEPGESDERDVIDIPSGSLQLQAGGETIAIPVEGDAGC